jgi:hypothetical protein
VGFFIFEKKPQSRDLKTIRAPSGIGFEIKESSKSSQGFEN